MLEDDNKIPGENIRKKCFIFLAIAFCKFGHLKKTCNKDIYTPITNWSFKLGQLIAGDV